LSRLTDTAAAAKNSSVRNRLRDALQALVTELEASRDQPVSILRNQFLPYRSARLAQRAPVMAPAIVPSYADPAASTPPTLADISAGPDVPLNDEVLQQAAVLGHDYIRIYEFVRNQVTTEWYAGGMKGALGTLRQKSGKLVVTAP